MNSLENNVEIEYFKEFKFDEFQNGFIVDIHKADALEKLMSRLEKLILELLDLQDEASLLESSDGFPRNCR
jgi:vacuolar-type H+-ATPase subunit I/STV1